jgi:hypothetical protein
MLTATTEVQPMTKGLVTVVAFMAAIAIDAHQTGARGAAWCLVTSGGGGRSCSFYTFEQCLASRAGGSSHCEQNPNFRTPAEAPRSTRSERRR